MYTLEIENENKEKLVLTQNESNYQVINVEGLTPPEAEITTIKVANLDGERFKSSRLDMRNIVITVKLSGEVEKNRIKLYNFFDTGNLSTIYYSNGSRKVKIEGYCETVEGDLFSESQEVQLSIICPDPYWKGLNKIVYDISQTFGSFQFPFAIDSNGIEFSQYIDGREAVVINRGQGASGMIIKMTAMGDSIANPIIYNVNTGEFFKVNITLNSGDSIEVNTYVGKKSITKTVDGVVTNILNLVGKGSTWFQLNKGYNLYTYHGDANQGHLRVVFEFDNLYKGV